VAVMVQGGEHGGSVAAPIATRILSRAFAMEAGTYDAQVAWLAPAQKPNPFQMIAAVNFKDTDPGLAASDEENLDGSTSSDMAVTSANPDVEPEADASGRVAGQKRAIRPPPPPPPPARKPNFFERLFGVRPKPPPPAPSQPVRRSTPGRR